MSDEASPSIVCPKCGRRSFNLHDVEERYCGWCHDWYVNLSIPAIAFGPLGRPHAEELRFWRLIDERETEADGWQIIVLACGHRFTFEHMPETQEYAYCPECMRLATRIESVQSNSRATLT